MNLEAPSFNHANAAESNTDIILRSFFDIKENQVANERTPLKTLLEREAKLMARICTHPDANSAVIELFQRMMNMLCEKAGSRPNDLGVDRKI